MSYRIGNWYVYKNEKTKNRYATRYERWEWIARSQDQVHVFSRKKDIVDFANVQFMIGAK